MLDIISVGPGEAVLLTDDAKQAIDRADAVWCAARHAVLVPPEKARPLSPLEGAIEQMRLSSDAGQSAAVLVSGDAGLYSLLEMLKRKIGGEYLRVHPGVSALQLFAARLGVSWQDAKILSAHGRALSESALCHAVRTHRQTFCFLDAAHTAPISQTTPFGFKCSADTTSARTSRLVIGVLPRMNASSDRPTGGRPLSGASFSI